MNTSTIRNLGTLALVVIAGLSTASRKASGQNVYKDYVTDSQSQYSPFDHQRRGLIYRMHTGHAGFFGNCDDDRDKMVSPYIDWHCRCRNVSPAYSFLQELTTDIFRKSDRLADGAGACVWGRCHDCNLASDECQCQQDTYANRSSTPNHLDYRSGQISNQTANQATRNRSGAGTMIPRSDLTFVDRRYNPTPALQGSSSRIQGIASGRLSAGNRSQEPGRKVDRSGDYFQPASGTSANSYSERSVAYSARFRSSEQFESIYQQEARRVDRSLSQRSTQNRGNNVSQNLDRPTNQSPTPRYESAPRLVPEDRFRQIEAKSVIDRRAGNQRSGTFQLSSGSVYSRPNFNQTMKQPNQEPVQDRQSDPRYSRFPLRGGSKYR